MTVLELPWRLAGGERDDDYTALGVRFGAGGPVVRAAWLPDGWSQAGDRRERGWRYLLDGRGLRRVAVFDRGGPGGRVAHMALVNVGRDVAARAAHSGDGIAWEKLDGDERCSAVACLHHAARSPTRRVARHARRLLDTAPH